METAPLHESKIKSRDELADRLRALKGAGKKIGFTSGVFDLVHPGHVAYLESARLECDVLVVGINSDRSVRENKGDLRPICREADRARVVAGLQSVDLVFVFDEKNNNKNIEILKPDVYLKAGDYDRSKLSSAQLVEAYGGKTVLVPFADGHGTTGIIERVIGRYSAEAVASPYPRPRPAIFLDRDGTINEHVEYIHEVEKFRLIPGALEGLKRLKEHGFRLVVVTNQPGIGMGYFSKEDFFVLNRELLKQARAYGVTFDRVYFCPHTDNDRCRCRKPGTEFIERAVKDLNIDLDRSFVVGDMTGDLMLAHNAGCRGVLVRTGIGGADKRFEVSPAYVADDLLRAADFIIDTTGPISVEQETKIGEAKSFDPKERFIHSRVLESIGAFSEKIGHDINSFLGAIQGSVDIINNRIRKAFPSENPFQQPLELISQSIEQGESLSRKLRGYVRPGELRRDPLDLVVLGRDLVERLTAIVPEGVTVTFEGPPSLRLLGDEFALAEVIYAVGLNGVESLRGRPAGVISVVVRDEIAPGDASTLARPRGVISISDTGGGISSVAAGELFTLKNPRGKGYGLALPMAQELAQRHGGEIVVASTEAGTVVTIALPRTD
ncbi:MAG: hypothetical protein RL417_1099 [Pseudomonadota bacterium]|jgi:D-glycero-D-manno-heptose 1,7-bisphosphate phosphatase